MTDIEIVPPADLPDDVAVFEPSSPDEPTPAPEPETTPEAWICPCGTEFSDHEAYISHAESCATVAELAAGPATPEPVVNAVTVISEDPAARALALAAYQALMKINQAPNTVTAVRAAAGTVSQS